VGQSGICGAEQGSTILQRGGARLSFGGALLERAYRTNDISPRHASTLKLNHFRLPSNHFHNPAKCSELPPGSNSVLFGKESNFRLPFPYVARRTVTICILCSQHNEDANEYEEADCTLFKMGVTGLAWQRLRIAPIYLVLRRSCTSIFQPFCCRS
jgi:hypothetical protein